MISVVLFGHKLDSFSGHFESLTPYYPKEPGLVWWKDVSLPFSIFIHLECTNSRQVSCGILFVYVSNQQVLECSHSRQVSCAILFMYVSNQQVFHLRQVELFCFVVNACDRLF